MFNEGTLNKKKGCWYFELKWIWFKSMIKIWHQRSTFIRQLYLFKNLYLKVFSLGSSSTNCWVNPFWQIFLWKYILKKISIEEKKVLRVWERERRWKESERESLITITNNNLLAIFVYLLFSSYSFFLPLRLWGKSTVKGKFTARG